MRKKQQFLNMSVLSGFKSVAYNNETRRSKAAPGFIYLKGEGSAVGRRGQVKNRKKHAAIPIAQAQYMGATLNKTKAKQIIPFFFSGSFCHCSKFINHTETLAG